MNGIPSEKVRSYRARFGEIMSDQLTDLQRDKKLSELMTRMERKFQIPGINNEDYNWENPNVMDLYRVVSNARVTV